LGNNPNETPVGAEIFAYVIDSTNFFWR
jgi:hypothetical protein